MKKPRCGNPDDYTLIPYNTNSTHGRHKRYAFIVNTTQHFGNPSIFFKFFFLILLYIYFFCLGLRFKSKVISYKIYNYTNKLSKEVVDKEIARAFKVWEKLANKTFRQIEDNSGKDCIRIA